MRKSSIAALLSAFVCPGAGHLYLKKTVVGLSLLGASLWSLYILISNAFSRALDISDKIISGEVAPDISTIRQLIDQSSIGSETQLVSIATTVLIVAWLIGIFDCLRIGQISDEDKDKAQE